MNVTNNFSGDCRIEDLEARVFLSAVPRPDHVVIVVEENKTPSEILGSLSAPYITSLANGGANFTNSHGVTHPSQPNYLALFSGSTQGVTDNSTPHTFTAPNLGGELIGAGLTFGGYSEDLPSVGFTGDSSGAYQRKHNPWVNFTDNPSSVNMPFTSFPSSASYSSLPTVSIVVPNQLNDMHDGSILQGDTWLKNNLDSYAQWAKSHNSLLIVTFDEDDSSTSENLIATAFVGSMVKQGAYSENINHYNILRTVEDMYGLPHAGNAASATPITDVWTSTVTAPAAPTGLSATADSSVPRVSLKWTDASSNETGFTVQRSADSGSTFQTIATLGANTTSYTDSAVSGGKTYQYKVRAFNSGAVSPFTATVSATTVNVTPPPPTAPAAPTGLSATPDAVAAQVKLGWTDASSNETGFTVQRSDDGGSSFNTIATLGLNATSYTDNAVVGGATYQYQVRSFNSGGVSAFTPAVTATVAPEAGGGGGGGTGGVLFEAEDTTLLGAVDLAEHPGFTGSGYADFQNPSNDFVEWNVNVANAGTYNLDLRYANGSVAARQLEVSVNGTSLEVLDFVTTPDWNTWADENFGVALNAGDNTVRVTAIGTSGPNVDSLAVAPIETVQAPTEDGYARDGIWSDVNFGSAPELVTKVSSSGWNRVSYLKFDLSNASTISQATLRLFGSLSNSQGSNIRTAAYAVGTAEANWTHDNLTWNDKPDPVGSPLATVAVSGTAGQWYEWDLTSFLQGQKAAGNTIVTIALKSLDSSIPYTTFSSTDAATNQPQLVLTA